MVPRSNSASPPPTGSFRWVDNRVPVRDTDGRLVRSRRYCHRHHRALRAKADEKIAQLARTDGLTGLANRATFSERLQQCFAAAQRGALPFAVLYLDLDKFKPVNDTHGHPSGDSLLEVADHLHVFRSRPTSSQGSGDRFAIAPDRTPAAANAASVGRISMALNAHRIRRRTSSPSLDFPALITIGSPCPSGWSRHSVAKGQRRNRPFTSTMELSLKSSIA